jgi:hypothetical protein
MSKLIDISRNKQLQKKLLKYTDDVAQGLDPIQDESREETTSSQIKSQQNVKSSKK